MEDLELLTPQEVIEGAWSRFSRNWGPYLRISLVISLPVILIRLLSIGLHFPSPVDMPSEGDFTGWVILGIPLNFLLVRVLLPGRLIQLVDQDYHGVDIDFKEIWVYYQCLHKAPASSV